MTVEMIFGTIGIILCFGALLGSIYLYGFFKNRKDKNKEDL